MASIRVLVTEDTNMSAINEQAQVSSSNGKTKQGNATISALKSSLKTMGGVLLNEAKGYAIQNIGTWSGSSYNQVKVDNALAWGNIGMGLITNPAYTLAQTAFSLASQSYQIAVKRTWENRQLNQQRQRAGYTITTYSRGR